MNPPPPCNEDPWRCFVTFSFPFSSPQLPPSPSSPCLITRLHVRKGSLILQLMSETESENYWASCPRRGANIFGVTKWESSPTSQPFLTASKGRYLRGLGNRQEEISRGNKLGPWGLGGPSKRNPSRRRNRLFRVHRRSAIEKGVLQLSVCKYVLRFIDVQKTRIGAVVIFFWRGGTVSRTGNEHGQNQLPFGEVKERLWILHIVYTKAG